MKVLAQVVMETNNQKKMVKELGDRFQMLPGRRSDNRCENKFM